MRRVALLALLLLALLPGAAAAATPQFTMAEIEAELAIVYARWEELEGRKG